MGLMSAMGPRAVARCDALGALPYSEDGAALTRRYLTAPHKHALEALGGWMREAGMSVRLDPLGSLVGRYEGTSPGAPALVIGSHIDTVPAGGRYDGALGVMIGIECVESFHRRGERLPFALEVMAFGDEEGSRFPSSMLCSRATAASLDPTELEVRDADGISLGDALAAFGLDPEKATEAARAPREVLAYVEAHIEQGPVLEADGLPIGAVTAIAAQLRLVARFTGLAGHAGTTPMRLRADALAAAAEGVVAIERICRAGADDLVGTVGRISTTSQAFNVIVGEAEIGIDIRAGVVKRRDAAAAEIRAALLSIADARGLRLQMREVQDLAGCPCDPALTDVLAESIARVGVTPRFLMSGAGHDAMMMAALAPVAMLFIRCEGGVSHNGAERVAAEDVDHAVRALVEFIKLLGART